MTDDDMTGTETETVGDERTDDPTEVRDGGPTDRWRTDPPGQPLERRSVETLVELGALAGLLLLAAVTAFGFYTSASAAIDRLVDAEYRPIFQAAFNLVVLLVAGVGISVLLKRRTDATDDDPTR